ncbi:unnamed protein product [Bursaphelenchus xylophilus]|uniref:(pine wood nematode) hypothetical protein n=1 Tax=Bursaphelenchus xylophilus TaxID=6326 RepID=A0A1I7RRF7_BURXY|nr:unnamed protein product [Bursaphelenchus xylophilus]CAG9131006.1 unnamed protein product [Bursaphelenchus xylophilus]
MVLKFTVILLLLSTCDGYFIDKEFEWKYVKYLEAEVVDEWIDRLNTFDETKNTLRLARKLGEELQSDDDYEKFFDHILQFNKNYETEEELSFRFEVIKNSLKDIEKRQETNPEAQYGLTELSDLTKEEFFEFYANLQMKDLEDFPLIEDNPESNVTAKLMAPASFDWRTAKKVSGVKDQKRCGSCYAFAAVAAIESIHAIKRGQLYDLSAQQAVSCTFGNVNHGCQGGVPDNVMSYFTTHGITTWDKFPYVSGDHQQIPPCTPKPSVTKLNRIGILKAHDENGIKETVFNNGPVVSGIDASALQHYRGGIVHHQVGKPSLNHAVLTVGYGSERGDDYFIIKNSWGRGWGEGGYFRCGRNRNDMNIALYNVAAYI